MRHIVAVFVALVVIAEVNSEAFFVPRLFGGSRRAAPTRIIYPHGYPGRSVKSYGGGKKLNYQVKPQTLVNQNYIKKPHVSQKPNTAYSTRPSKAQTSYPRPAQKTNRVKKLDYSGWKPIGFDENAPAAYKSIGQDVLNDIVTLDIAIANAPQAQSDSNLIFNSYSEPPPEPIVQEIINDKTYRPADASFETSFSSSSATYVKPIPVVSSYGSPVPAVPYIPSTADVITAATQYNALPASKYNAASAPQYNAAPAPAPKYNAAPAPAPQYNAVPAPQYSSVPAPAPQYSSVPATEYKSSVSKYKTPAPVFNSIRSNYNTQPKVPTLYITSPAPIYKYKELQTAKYQTTVTAAPEYKAPSVTLVNAYNAPRAPAPAPKYEATEDKQARAYQKTRDQKNIKTSFSGYNFPSKEPTKSPVVLPSYTPAPDTLGSSNLKASTYDPNSFNGEEFPIISLITADSDIPDEQKYVSFTIGSDAGKAQPEEQRISNEPVRYQNTVDSASLAEEVSSGSVYVQKPSLNKDELYYIYYEDPVLDPSYGQKVERNVAPIQAAAPASDIPLYDYEDGEIEYRRDTRDSTNRDYSGGNYRDIGGHSSVSFNFNVGGKTSGFSYNL